MNDNQLHLRSIKDNENLVTSLTPVLTRECRKTTQVALGTDFSFDATSGNFTKDNADLSFMTTDLIASLILINKANTFAASYYHTREDLSTKAINLADLHHPNFVAFYGDVLDGPGGSVATRMMLMNINGWSIITRNLDKRKRRLIVMDVAFLYDFVAIIFLFMSKGTGIKEMDKRKDKTDTNEHEIGKNVKSRSRGYDIADTSDKRGAEPRWQSPAM
ncbi:serinethreonine-protein kinase ctr1 [Tanacetum coccineum]